MAREIAMPLKVAHAVPRNGAHPLVVDRVAQDLDNLGYRKVICRTGAENAIAALKKFVKETWS